MENQPKKMENVSYPKLPPRRPSSMDSMEYITERFNNSIAWYDKKAAKIKKRFIIYRLVTVIGGALVPVLINLEIGGLDMKMVTTVISLIGVFALALDGVYHYGEQWTNYRSTEQFLRREYYLYSVSEGPYRTLNDDDSYKLFVERVEERIAAENSSTLRVMATVSENKIGTSSLFAKNMDKIKNGNDT